MVTIFYYGGNLSNGTTKDVIKKMQKGQKRLWKNPEYRQHMIEVHKGKKASEETKTKMSKSNAKYWLGKHLSAETIENTFYHEANKYLLYLIQQEREFLDEHICKKNQKPLPRIRIKYMTSRWGSCTPAKSNISISARLIHFPHECFSYVLLHEYAHILVANHSKDFYAVVKTYMPDYKKYSDYLNH